MRSRAQRGCVLRAFPCCMVAEKANHYEWLWILTALKYNVRLLIHGGQSRKELDKCPLIILLYPGCITREVQSTTTTIHAITCTNILLFTAINDTRPTLSCYHYMSKRYLILSHDSAKPKTITVTNLVIITSVAKSFNAATRPSRRTSAAKTLWQRSLI